MAGLGRLDPNRRQVYNASGEATPSEDLPDKFVSTNAATSPIHSQLVTPAGFHPWGPLVPGIVNRAERKKGMRYLNAGGHITMPVQRVGADGPPFPFTSAFNKRLHGPIHNAGFNDALYQAGYPGWNLALSFKVPTLPQTTVNSGGTRSVPPLVPTRGQQKLHKITQKLTGTRRATGQPKGT